MGRLSTARTIHNSTASDKPCAAGFPLLRGRPTFRSTIMPAQLSSWMGHGHPGVLLIDRSHRRQADGRGGEQTCIGAVMYLHILPIFHYQGSPRSENPSINEDIWRSFFKSLGKDFLKSFSNFFCPPGYCNKSPGLRCHPQQQFPPTSYP